MKSKYVAEINVRECVACGVCASTCPVKAVEIVRGLHAEVNEEMCVGCQKCAKACPACVIRMKARGVLNA